MLGLPSIALLTGSAFHLFGSSVAVQVVGPVTPLHIVNAPISPDGFSRPAVLAEGTFPGPLIVANKVRRR